MSSEPKTVWKGERYQEAIHGQDVSMFWSSDRSEEVYSPRSVTLWSCGKCGIGLPETGGWPRKCSKGHLNDRKWYTIL